MVMWYRTDIRASTASIRTHDVGIEDPRLLSPSSWRRHCQVVLGQSCNLADRVSRNILPFPVWLMATMCMRQY